MKKTALIALLFMLSAKVFGLETTPAASFNRMLKTYYVSKNALARDKQNIAGVNAGILVQQILAFPSAQLSQPQKVVWRAQVVNLKKYAQLLQFEKDLEMQRKYFENLSYSMIKLVKGLGLTDSQVFIQYCPMVRASWLNEIEEIQNPYYGSKMYDCGEVKETVDRQVL